MGNNNAKRSKVEGADHTVKSKANGKEIQVSYILSGLLLSIEKWALFLKLSHKHSTNDWFKNNVIMKFDEDSDSQLLSEFDKVCVKIFTPDDKGAANNALFFSCYVPILYSFHCPFLLPFLSYHRIKSNILKEFDTTGLNKNQIDKINQISCAENKDVDILFTPYYIEPNLADYIQKKEGQVYCQSLLFQLFWIFSTFENMGFTLGEIDLGHFIVKNAISDLQFSIGTQHNYLIRKNTPQLQFHNRNKITLYPEMPLFSQKSNLKNKFNRIMRDLSHLSKIKSSCGNSTFKKFDNNTSVTETFESLIETDIFQSLEINKITTHKTYTLPNSETAKAINHYSKQFF